MREFRAYAPVLIVSSRLVPEVRYLKVGVRVDVHSLRVIVERPCVPEEVVQSDKSLLRKRVTRDDVLLRRVSDVMADEIRGAHGAVEEGCLSGRSVVADGGFNESSVIIEVVLDDDVPAVLTPALVRHIVQDICREEPVGRVGRRADDRHDPLDAVGECLVLSDGEHIAGAAQCL